MTTLALLAVGAVALAQDAAPTDDPSAGAATATSEAADEEPKERIPVTVAVRGIAETWSDPGIGTVYASGGLLGGVGVVVPLFGPVALDVEAAYRRMYTDEGSDTPDDTLRMEVLPVSFLAEYHFRSDESPVDGFVGLGPSFAGYREHHPPDETGLGLTRGAKFSLELRTGLRFDTGLVQPRMAPTSPIQGVDLEIYGARRMQLPGGTGFDLDAWRGGVGLAFRI